MVHEKNRNELSTVPSCAGFFQLPSAFAAGLRRAFHSSGNGIYRLLWHAPLDASARGQGTTGE